MHGRLVELPFDAPSLRGNPLGDPSRRTLHALVPPGPAGRRFPSVTFLHGFTGTGRGWLSGGPFQPSVAERIDGLVAAGEIPPIVALFPDGFTGVGGTQWTNSPAVGRYADYAADDVQAAAEAELPVIARREARAVVGKSSGGYGALHLASTRPDRFALAGAHAPDCYFEYCYLPDLPKAAAGLAAAGGDPAAWLDAMKARARETKMGGGDHPVLNVVGMAAHYSPRAGAPLGLELPFELPSGRIREEAWARWLEHDPVRFVPRRAEALRRLGGCFLDCGTRDEFNLRWGTRMVAAALRAAGVEVEHQEFEDGHMGINYRFDASLRWLAPRLARDEEGNR
jgi:S-formylglutathione hydrolase FrmB